MNQYGNQSFESLNTRVLGKLYAASLKAAGAGCIYPQWGYDNLCYYIATGRAPTEFVQRIDKLGDKQLLTLIRRASKGSTTSGIDAAKKYLKWEG